MRQEIYDLMQDRLQGDLEDMANLDIEADGDVRKKVAEEVSILWDKIVEVDKIEMDAYDRQEKRNLEERKLASANAIEEEKSRLNWPKVGLEMAKIIVPLLIHYGYHAVTTGRLLEYDKTGHICPTFWKILGMPREKK